MNMSAIEKANAAKRVKREAGELETLNPIEKAGRDPKSLRLAINGKCWDCVGQDADPYPKQRVRDCPMIDCTLWPVRPWKNVKGRSGHLDPENSAKD